MAADRPAAAERSRSLMHGIFVGEIQALEGAGRTCFDFDDDEAPFQLKLDMARQCWDESRHCEISIKLGEHMGSEIGEYGESTFLYAAACNPDPVLRLTGVNRALEGLAIDVFNSMKEFGESSTDPILTFCEDWMLADEVTHVKMGSDWLRRLTEKDPERRERALEFQRTVDKIFSLGGFRGESEENPIQLAAALPRARGLHRRRGRRDRRDRAAGAGRGGRHLGGGGGRGLTMGRVHVTPDPFTVVPYEVPVLVGIVEEAAALVGFPSAVEIDLEVDEDLPHPLVGTVSDVVDGKASLWMSGGNLESTHRHAAVLGAVGAARADADAAARQRPALRRVRHRAVRHGAHARGTRRVGRVDARARRAARPPDPARPDALRLPAAARLQRRRRRRVRPALGCADTHLGRPARDLQGDGRRRQAAHEDSRPTC